MKRYFFLIMLLPLLLAGCGTASDNFFGPSSGGNGGGDNGDIQLVGTKWDYKDFYFWVNDDYTDGGFSKWTVVLYFYSDTEAFACFSSKDEESQEHTYLNYTYTTANGHIYLTPIYETQKWGIERNELIIKNSNCITDVNGNAFEKSTITADERKMISNYVGDVGPLRWYYDDNDVITIVGNGDMPDFTTYDQRPWHDYRFTKVVISDGVTSVGNGAFGGKFVPYLYLSNTLTRIGVHAFSDAFISKLELPESVQVIEAEAFLGNDNLDIYVPGNVESIGKGAFSNCKSVYFSENVKLKRLESITFGSVTEVYGIENLLELTTIVEGAAIWCGTKDNYATIELPNSLREIGEYAFIGYFNKVYIGFSLTTIQGTPFYSSIKGSIYINQSTPPTLKKEIVKDAKNWKLYVPDDSKSAYASAPYWKEFGAIYEGYY